MFKVQFHPKAAKEAKAWRLIFRIIEARDTVEILSINTHDEAYKSAERRVD